MKLGCDTFLMSQWYKKDDNAEPAVFYFLPITDVLHNYDNDDPQKTVLREKVWSLVTSKVTSNFYKFWHFEEKNKYNFHWIMIKFVSCFVVVGFCDFSIMSFTILYVAY